MRGADEDMRQILGRAALARESLGGICRRRLTWRSSPAISSNRRSSKPCSSASIVAAARGADFLRKVADRAVGLGQRGVAQEQARRKALDRAAHHAVGVLRLDFAVDLDPQFARAGRRR